MKEYLGTLALKYRNPGTQALSNGNGPRVFSEEDYVAAFCVDIGLAAQVRSRWGEPESTPRSRADEVPLTGGVAVCPSVGTTMWHSLRHRTLDIQSSDAI